MGIKLFEFQQEAVKRALNSLNYLLCVRVGGGKTLIAMFYAKLLRKKKLADKIAFACTVSAAVAVAGEFKDKNTFVRKAITKKELESKTEDIDLALQAFRDIENGEFKVSEKMIQDIYSKSYGKVSNHLDEAINTSTIRHEFSFYEYP